MRAAEQRRVVAGERARQDSRVEVDLRVEESGVSLGGRAGVNVAIQLAEDAAGRRTGLGLGMHGRVQGGHQERGAHALSGQVAQRDDQASVSRAAEVVDVVSSDLPAWNARGGDVPTRKAGQRGGLEARVQGRGRLQLGIEAPLAHRVVEQQRRAAPAGPKPCVLGIGRPHEPRARAGAGAPGRTAGSKCRWTGQQTRNGCRCARRARRRLARAPPPALPAACWLRALGASALRPWNTSREQSTGVRVWAAIRILRSNRRTWARRLPARSTLTTIRHSPKAQLLMEHRAGQGHHPVPEPQTELAGRGGNRRSGGRSHAGLEPADRRGHRPASRAPRPSPGRRARSRSLRPARRSWTRRSGLRGPRRRRGPVVHAKLNLPSRPRPGAAVASRRPARPAAADPTRRPSAVPSGSSAPSAGRGSSAAA